MCTKCQVHVNQESNKKVQSDNKLLIICRITFLKKSLRKKIKISK